MVLPCGTKVSYTLFDGSTYTANIEDLTLHDIRRNLIIIKVAQTEQSNRSSSITVNVSEGRKHAIEMETILTMAHPECHAIQFR